MATCGTAATTKLTTKPLSTLAMLGLDKTCAGALSIGALRMHMQCDKLPLALKGCQLRLKGCDIR